MAFFTARLSVLAAVALVTVAQVVVAPASCCLLKAAVFGGPACCERPTVASATASCCHAPATDAAIADEVPSAPHECLWCSAGPKISVSERVLPPVMDLATISVVAVEPVATSSLVTAEESLEEPFHRTALAACAWLCVWRK